MNGIELKSKTVPARLEHSHVNGERVGRFSAAHLEYLLEKRAAQPTTHVDVRRIRQVPLASVEPQGAFPARGTRRSADPRCRRGSASWAKTQ